MSQCVPSWDLDDDLLHHRRDRHGPLPSSAAVATATAANYDVMELMWNGVGPGKPIIRNLSSIAAVSTAAGRGTDGGGGTLECVVDQARSGAHQTAADALVPCSDAGAQKPARVSGASCTSQGSATPTAEAVGRRRSMPPAGDEEDEGCGGGGGEGSPETGNGSFAGGKSLGVDQHDSLHSRDELGEKGITSISAKRSREAAVHSQSERKRRDRINQKMKTLQKLLPNSSKTDKASVLDEVIEYLKLLQAQVQTMNRMSSIPMAMMLPITMQQQLQLSMLAQMTQISRMGMSLGMNEQSILNMVPPPPILHPSTFLPLPPTMSGAWDARTAECLQLQGHRVIPDMVPTFMGYQAQQQPMSSEAYNRLAVLYQQLYQQPLGSNQKTRN